jgi:hypothetical protein
MNDLLIALYLTDEHTELKVELFYLWCEKPSFKFQLQT